MGCFWNFFNFQNYHKRSLHLQCIILLFLNAMQDVPTEQIDAELKVLQISPKSSFVALGQPVKLNITVTVNVTDERYYIRDLIDIRWSFRRFSSKSFETLARALWRVYWDRVLTYSYNSRASIVDNSTLEVINATLDDSGIYRCYVTSRWLYYTNQHLYMYFNVTIKAKKHQKSYFEGIEWYIPLISGIVGVLIGIGLVYGFLRIRKRNVLATQRGTQRTAGSTVYNELGALATSRPGNSPIAGGQFPEQCSPEAVPLTIFHRSTTRS